MSIPPPAPREDERLALLHELQLPAAALVPGLEAIARLAARQTGCRVGTVSVLDRDRLWLHAASGSRLIEQPREHSFSAHAIVGDDVFEVPDVRLDARFANHPLLSATPPTHFFAAMPVRVEGLAVGTVTVVHHEPRRLEPEQRAALRDLAALAAALFEARLRELRQHAREERVRSASRAGSDWLWESDAQGVITWVSESVQEHTGWPQSAEMGIHSLSVNRPPPGDLRESWDRYRAARARHEPFRDGIAERDSARGRLLVSLSGQPTFDRDGRFAGYRGAARDVTAEIAERARAQRSEQLLMQAIEAVRAGVMISGPDGKVLISNASWRTNIGRFATSDDVTWEGLLREMVRQGVYPEAAGREEEFVRWRLAVASPDATPHELRFADQDALVSDQLLPDGTVIHLSLNITERKQAEREIARQRAELVESQSRLAAVLRAVPDLWFVIDGDDRYLLCSDDHHPWLVQPFDQLRGRTFGEVLPSKLAQRSLAAVRRARESGAVQRVEYELTMPDGTQRSFEARISPMPGGQVLYLTRDLTERVRDAERLRISEDLYRSVAATISDGLLVVGPNGAIVASNPSACEGLGLQADVLVGRRLSELGYRLRTEDDRSIAMDDHPVARVLRGGPSIRDVPHLLHRPDGSTRLMQMSVRPLRAHAEGMPISGLVTFRDITDQRAAEKALAAAEERWKFALEGAGDGVWDNDEDTRRTFYSPRWKEMLGYAADEIGHSLKEWSGRVHPDDRARVFEAVRRYRAGEIPAYRTEHRLRHKDGHWVWVLDRGKIVERHPDGRPRRVVGTHTDITRLKLAEQALRDKQAAELASRAKSEFLSRMSHEMRTPLNAVIGFTQLLRMQPDGGPAKVAEYTDHVLRASEHLLALVNEVLDLQRLEEGRISLQPEAVQLAPFVAAALDLLRPMAQRQDIALASQVAEGIWVYCDPRSLRQVLINVISNAVKYNRPGGWVCVGLLEAPAGRVVLGVEDTGSGLSDDQLVRLFQPFERLGHESSEIEGSGLGLVIARSLCVEMGGTLTLSSVKDAGTLARIELPGCDAPAILPDALADASQVPAPPSAPPQRPALKLLYVEDNRINALLFEEAMRVLGGYDLRVVEDGANALELVREWTPQVLVLDANLPDMSGFEVLRRLRELPSLAGVPAYMCSADAMPEDIQRARDAGFEGYWTKPIEMGVVSADLEALRQSAHG
jgi:PAS domain S-box-containing protein